MKGVRLEPAEPLLPSEGSSSEAPHFDGKVTAVCEQHCPTFADCGGLCQAGPPWLSAMAEEALYELLDFANRVQKWSLRVKGEATFGRAAKRFDVPVEKIAAAVIAHYWMFTLDIDRPLAERRIEHDGE